MTKALKIFYHNGIGTTPHIQAGSAQWRAHGLVPVMQQCWQAGVVLAGWSAGSLCWHRGGPTDPFGDSLALFTDGLGLQRELHSELLIG